MEEVVGQVAGSAALQGDLWSARARDWAMYQESTLRPVYEAVLAHAAMSRGTTLLDAGCGSGLFCRLANAAGARVRGLDASPALIAIARERVFTVKFDVGELEDLPFDDASFDVVTGFNSFEFAANPVAALAEARRVLTPGGSLYAIVWGRPEECEASAYLGALASLLPPSPSGTPAPFALSRPGSLEALGLDAGLVPLESFDVPCEWRYADRDIALRALLSPGPAVRAVRAAGEIVVREAVERAIRPFRNSRGGYQLENVFRVVVARA